jgi:phage FluMu protein Com
MGTTYRVFCDCGFKTTVNEGGSRDGFRSYSAFPFWCDRCGLVEVNTIQKIKCPHCKSKEILPYGDQSITSENHGTSLAEYTVIWTHDNLYNDAEEDEADDDEYQIPTGKNYGLCPRCRTFRLVFRSMIHFD